MSDCNQFGARFRAPRKNNVEPRVVALYIMRYAYVKLPVAFRIYKFKNSIFSSVVMQLMQLMQGIKVQLWGYYNTYR